MSKSKITASYEVKIDPRAYGMDFGTVAERVMRDARKSMPAKTTQRQAVSACRRAVVALRGVRGVSKAADLQVNLMIADVLIALKALE